MVGSSWVVSSVGIVGSSDSVGSSVGVLVEFSSSKVIVCVSLQPITIINTISILKRIFVKEI